MFEVRKSFDKDLYNIADTEAKKHMVGWLKEHDHIQLDTSETKSFDIISCVDPKLPRHLYEVEIKYSWKGDWPSYWKEIRIPYRKIRLLEKWKAECPDDLLTFVVFRNDCKKAFHIDGNTLLISQVMEVSNRNISKGEKFFHIPIEDTYLVDMTYEGNS